jgi:ATP-dependent DNA ligase
VSICLRIKSLYRTEWYSFVLSLPKAAASIRNLLLCDCFLCVKFGAGRLRQTGTWMQDRIPKARFVEPMLLQRAEKLPEGDLWLCEVKLDGFRAEAIKSAGRLRFRSRNDKDFNAKYPAIVQALAAIPDETVIDGEIVALDEAGRPSFSALQNHGFGTAPLVYYVFDSMVLAGKDVMNEALTKRRELLQGRVLTKLGEPIRESPELDAGLPALIRFWPR